LKEVKAWAERRRGTGTSACVTKPPKFDGTTSWAVVRCQFETVAEHNCWVWGTPHTWSQPYKAGPPTCYTKSWKERPIKKPLRPWRTALGTSTWPPHIPVSKKTRTQGVGEPLQEFATAVEQLAHCAYPALPEGHIRKESGKVLADGVEDPCHKNPAAAGRRENGEQGSQALELQAMLLGAWPQKMSAGTFWGSRSSPTGLRGRRQVAWGARPLPEQLPLWEGGRKRLVLETRWNTSERHGKLASRSEWWLRNNGDVERRGGHLSGNEQVPA
jgi:hypothetical protein